MEQFHKNTIPIWTVFLHFCRYNLTAVKTSKKHRLYYYIFIIIIDKNMRMLYNAK